MGMNQFLNYQAFMVHASHFISISRIFIMIKNQVFSNEADPSILRSIRKLVSVSKKLVSVSRKLVSVSRKLVSVSRKLVSVSRNQH